MPQFTSKHIRALKIAEEPTPGCPSPTTGNPNLAELTDTLLPVRLDAASLVLSGEMRTVGRQHNAADFGMLADEADAPDALELRYGTIPFRTPVYSNPSPAGIFTDLRTTPAAKVLSSALVPRTAITTRTVTVASRTDENTFTVDDATGLEVGQLVALDKNGRRSSNLVVDVNGTTVKTLKPFHADVADDDVIRIGQTWDLTAHGSIGKSLAVPMSFGDGRQTAYMCRADQIVLELVGNSNNNGNGKLEMNATLATGGIVQDAGAAIDGVIGAYTDEVKAQITTPSGRKSAESARCWASVSDAATQREDAATSTPVAVGATQLRIESMTLTITMGMEPYGEADHALGNEDLAPGQPTAKLDLIVRTAPMTAAEVYAAVANYRGYDIPFGPLGAHGAAICMPAGRCTSDPRLIEEGKSHHRYAFSVELAAAHVEKDGGVAGLRIALF